MKKVAIVTLIGYYNYGNRLQNYATQEVIKDLGYEVQTIIYYKRVEARKEALNVAIKRKMTSFLNKTNKQRYYTLKNKLIHILYKDLIYKRRRAFKLFTQTNISETDIIYDDYIFNNLAEDYDFFVTGSDQVWHPFIGDKPLYFLTFAPKGKRIAYAPSFGVAELPESCLEDYKKYISEIPYLSVREQSGADIIKKLTGREAIVLVDPTLMLTKEKWMSISKPAVHKPSRRYLLTYFLGELSNDAKKLIKTIAAHRNLEVVQLATFKDKKRFTADPAEFIDYVNSSDIVLTDSFHGTLFSILFEKPFIVFNRIGIGPSIVSRIETLLSKFKLESRRWQSMKGKNMDDLMNDLFEIDFSHVPSILEAERKKALGFLKMALNAE
ncbi:MAG: hypothetical protein PWP04_1470 [Candidatus Atribacteria bacterium]|nr:hypothetical protein [Candidatus Atribacteria bacterium]